MSLEELERMLEVEKRNMEQLAAAFNMQMGKCRGRVELLQEMIAEMKKPPAVEEDADA